MVGEGTVEFRGCRASYAAGELVIDNDAFERRWRVDRGLLHATSFRDLRSGREWLARPSERPAPCPPRRPPPTGPSADGPAETGSVRFSAEGGVFGPVQ